MPSLAPACSREAAKLYRERGHVWGFARAWHPILKLPPQIQQLV
jgi:hypothetical protein